MCRLPGGGRDMLQDLTGVDPQKIPLDDRDTMSIFTSSEVLGFVDDQV